MKIEERKEMLWNLMSKLDGYRVKKAFNSIQARNLDNKSKQIRVFVEENGMYSLLIWNDSTQSDRFYENISIENVEYLINFHK